MSMKDGTRYRRSRYRHSRNYVGNDMQGKQPLRWLSCVRVQVLCIEPCA